MGVPPGEEESHRRVAKPVGWDGMGPATCQGCPWGLPVARRGKRPLPSVAPWPQPLRGGEGTHGQFITEAPGRMGTLRDCPPMQGGGPISALEGLDGPKTSTEISEPLRIPPWSGRSLQQDVARSPFPRPTTDICLGGATRAGRGHFQPSLVLCFLHAKKLFSFAVW